LPWKKRVDGGQKSPGNWVEGPQLIKLDLDLHSTNHICTDSAFSKGSLRRTRVGEEQKETSIPIIFGLIALFELSRFAHGVAAMYISIINMSTGAPKYLLIRL
jgi:hypothetical protein